MTTARPTNDYYNTTSNVTHLLRVPILINCNVLAHVLVQFPTKYPCAFPSSPERRELLSKGCIYIYIYISYIYTSYIIERAIYVRICHLQRNYLCSRRHPIRLRIIRVISGNDSCTAARGDSSEGQAQGLAHGQPNQPTFVFSIVC